MTFCQISLLNLFQVSIANEQETRILQCLNETESCPAGYFPNRNAVIGSLKLKDNTVSKVNAWCQPLFCLYHNKEVTGSTVLA